MALFLVLSPNISQNYCSSSQGYSYSDPTAWDSWPENGCGESPLSSPLIIDESGNSFDYSFGQSPQTPAYTFSYGEGADLLGRSQSAYQVAYNNTQSIISPQATYSYVNPSVINKISLSYLGASFEDEDPEADYLKVSSPRTNSERRLSWRASSDSRKSSKSSRPTSSSSKPSRKRTKSSEASSKSSKSNKDSRLRTTPSKPRGSSSSETSKGDALRSNHNAVEKNYRNRLNAQFETLLECIPQEYDGADANSGNMSRFARERKVSKGDVLMLAQEHIKRLEKEGRGLEKRRNSLEGDMQRLMGALVTRDTIDGVL